MKTILRKILNSFRKKRKLRNVKKSGSISKERLILDLRGIGLEEGDTVFVHSSLSKLGFVENGPVTVIEALKSVIGDQGNLLFPAFSFPGGGIYGTISNQNYIFDSSTEPSYVGKISDSFWRQPGVKRSVHPTHSIAAFGPKADYYTSNHVDLESTWGEGTPFGKMFEENVKMLGLGVRLPMFTFFHCVEDLNIHLFPGLYHKSKMPVKVRMSGDVKTFELPYHDPEYLTDRIEMNSRIENFFTDHFLKSKKLIQGKVGMGESIMISAKDFCQLTLELAEQGKTIYKV